MPGGPALTDRRTLILAGSLATAGAIFAGAVVAAVNHGGTAGPSASPSAASTDGVNVSIVPLDPAADPQKVVDACARLVADVPDRVAGLARAGTTPETQRTAAWGSTTVVALRCGVPQPPGFVQGQGTVEVDGVQWYEQLDGPVVTWTTVDRAVRAQVVVPIAVSDQGSVLTALAGAVSKDLPAAAVSPFPLPSVEPVPAG